MVLYIKGHIFGGIKNQQIPLHNGAQKKQVLSSLFSAETTFKQRNILPHSRKIFVFTTEHGVNGTTGINLQHGVASVGHTKLHLLLLSWRGRCSYGEPALGLQTSGCCMKQPADWALPLSSEATLPHWDQAQKRKGHAADSLVDFAAALSLWGRSGEQLSALVKDTTDLFILPEI